MQSKAAAISHSMRSAQRCSSLSLTRSSSRAASDTLLAVRLRYELVPRNAKELGRVEARVRHVHAAHAVVDLAVAKRLPREDRGVTLARVVRIARLVSRRRDRSCCEEQQALSVRLGALAYSFVVVCDVDAMVMGVHRALELALELPRAREAAARRHGVGLLKSLDIVIVQLEFWVRKVGAEVALHRAALRGGGGREGVG